MGDDDALPDLVQTLPAEYVLYGKWMSGNLYRQVHGAQHFVVSLADGHYWTDTLDTITDDRGHEVPLTGFITYDGLSYGKSGGVKHHMRPGRVHFPAESSEWDKEIIICSVGKYYQWAVTPNLILRLAKGSVRAAAAASSGAGDDQPPWRPSATSLDVAPVSPPKDQVADVRLTGNLAEKLQEVLADAGINDGYRRIVSMLSYLWSSKQKDKLHSMCTILRRQLPEVEDDVNGFSSCPLVEIGVVMNSERLQHVRTVRR
jgi:hypothetical protein